MKTLPSVLFCITVTSASAGQAQALRCDNDLAQVMRDSKASVLRKCGAPFFTESFCRPSLQAVAVPGSDTSVLVSACEVVDEWSYNPGSGQFIAVLTFQSGTLRSIRYGGRIE